MSSKNGTEGDVIFGDVEKKYMASNFSFFNVTSDAYWEITLDGINIGDNKNLNICADVIEKTGTCGIAIDTGTSLFAGPTD
jgi:hypothetical protein